jgi:hypothetical protein
MRPSFYVPKDGARRSPLSYKRRIFRELIWDESQQVFRSCGRDFCELLREWKAPVTKFVIEISEFLTRILAATIRLLWSFEDTLEGLSRPGSTQTGSWFRKTIKCGGALSRP